MGLRAPTEKQAKICAAVAARSNRVRQIRRENPLRVSTGLPPDRDVHGRDPQCPVNVDTSRRSNVSNAQIADVRRRLGLGPNHPELSFAPAAKFGRSWPLNEPAAREGALTEGEVESGLLRVR
jgi:hypothetical protein